MVKDRQASPDRDIRDLWARGKFWEIFGFSGGAFTTLELAKQYSALTRAYYDSPEVKRMIDDAFATLNVPLTRKFYENCRAIMQAIRSEVGDKRYYQAERSMWDELWKWVSHRWQEPSEELKNSLKVKHAKSKITDSAKKAAYEAWVAENEFDMSVCWFCSKQISSNKNNLIVDMHRVLERFGDKIRYQPIPLTIPRCATCRSEHSFDKRLAVTIAVIAVGGAVGSFGVITGEWWVFIIPWVWAILGLVGSLGYLIGRGIAKLLKMRNPAKSEDYYKSCPIYKVALNYGYVDGEKPSNT